MGLESHTLEVNHVTPTSGTGTSLNLQSPRQVEQSGRLATGRSGLSELSWILLVPG